jgi:hypothetical protein
MGAEWIAAQEGIMTSDMPDAAVWHANANEFADELATDDEVIAYCASAGCQCDSVFQPDQNEDNGLLICTMCGCLMDGAIDYT